MMSIFEVLTTTKLTTPSLPKHCPVVSHEQGIEVSLPNERQHSEEGFITIFHQHLFVHRRYVTYRQ
jgi:hypothetical protein